MKKAMLLGTPEAAFYYHAGLIENALGNKDEARKLLQKALELNPEFDVRQAALAVAVLKEIA